MTSNHTGYRRCSINDFRVLVCEPQFSWASCQFNFHLPAAQDWINKRARLVQRANVHFQFASELILPKVKASDFIFENQRWRFRVRDVVACFEPVNESNNMRVRHRVTKHGGFYFRRALVGRNSAPPSSGSTNKFAAISTIRPASTTRPKRCVGGKSDKRKIANPAPMITSE